VSDVVDDVDDVNGRVGVDGEEVLKRRVPEELLFWLTEFEILFEDSRLPT
jgi:hypothetical protein